MILRFAFKNLFFQIFLLFRTQNKRLKQVLKSWGMYNELDINNYKKLESYFVEKLQELLRQKSIKKQTIGK